MGIFSIFNFTFSTAPRVLSVAFSVLFEPLMTVLFMLT